MEHIEMIPFSKLRKAWKCGCLLIPTKQIEECRHVQLRIILLDRHNSLDVVGGDGSGTIVERKAIMGSLLTFETET